jgi:diguanylate cyclase (GGDEF)-like protein
MLAMVIILVVTIIGLLVYNLNINKKLQELNNVNQKVTSLNVLQEFMNTIGEEETVDNKIKKINDILIEKYEIKYSTIVVFDGAEYVIKATNVNEKHWDTLRNLQNEEIFKDSISTAMPKSITVDNENETLPYQKLEFGRAKAAIFFPLYIDNIYIGYWILESGIPHAFDKLDTTILEVVKDNILAVLKSVSYQSVIENLKRKDLYSDLNNAEFLYGEGKKIIDRYPISSVGMFTITNLPQINDLVGRSTGNRAITEVSQYIKNSISNEYFFVRYMGPKFLLVFCGVETESVSDFVQELKDNVESIKIEVDEKDKKNTKKEYVNVKLNFVITTYYKGTALEKLNKKLEEYLNNADASESAINFI